MSGGVFSLGGVGGGSWWVRAGTCRYEGVVVDTRRYEQVREGSWWVRAGTSRYEAKKHTVAWDPPYRNIKNKILEKS